MATITKRPRADGTASYRASIRIKEAGRIVHQETRTFNWQKEAREWAAQREAALKRPGALARARNRHTLGDVLEWYIKAYGDGFGRSKLTTLKAMRAHELSDERLSALTPQRLIRHVEDRRGEGAGPVTAGNDLVWLRVVMKAARPGMGIDFDLQAIKDAQAFCRDQKLIARPKKRNRRPTADELKKLRAHFTRGDGRLRMPMADIMDFAIASSRRQEEITRLLWSDNDEKSHTGMVRDLKHPTDKEGNHREFKYTPEAWAIMLRQPRKDERIFPYNSKTISSTFTRACKLLGIEGLTFHDLRHEAVSRLFEQGYSIQEVMHFSLHESWGTLQRYTNTRARDVKHR